MHPELAAHGNFSHLKLGRLPKKDDPRTLKLTDYLDDAVILPTIPASYDYTTKVPSWPMYENDRLGDCTVAAVGHMIEAWTAAGGKEKVPLDASIVAAYWATGDGQDTGRNEIEVLNYWRNHGIASHKIMAYVDIDPTNDAHIRAAIYLFGGVYTGIDLPISAQQQSTWDVVGDGRSGDSAPGSWGGHAVPYEGFTASEYKFVTWGFTMSMTTAFNAAYTEEAYAILSSDFFRYGKTPQGFGSVKLMQDLAAIAGQRPG